MDLPFHRVRFLRLSPAVKIAWIVALISPALSAGELCPAMVKLPAGHYHPLYSKNSDEENKDSKNIEPVLSFCLDKAPVTNGQYLAFVKSKPNWKRSSAKNIFTDKNYLSHWSADLALGEAAPHNSPVTNVSWFAAKAYCKAQSKRLPTVAEWEYAGSADQKNRYAAQDSDNFAKKILDWYSRPTSIPLPNIKVRPANAYGIFDLHGLVWEWTYDFNTALVSGESRGDSALERQLYCGSGSVGSSDFRNYAAFMRYSFRSSMKANYCVRSLGFRCAKGK